ncbi:MAG: hypothetical protein IJV41_10940 [Oscillospiraceae bacterium]|nr:hypothetical protein [Oscillospiraceae bacterium]
MKKDGKYRFTLQFPAVTDEQIAVGELLESMGNRKSALIVEAVRAFFDNHPDFSADLEFRKKGKHGIRTERMAENDIQEPHDQTNSEARIHAQITDEHQTFGVPVNAMLDYLNVFLRP